MLDLQESLRIPNSAFSPFSLFIVIRWHPCSDSLSCHQTAQRFPKLQVAASGISTSDPHSSAWEKSRQETLVLQNWWLIDSPCSREFPVQLSNSHLSHLSLFSYHRFSLSVSEIWEKNPQNDVGAWGWQPGWGLPHGCSSPLPLAPHHLFVPL